MSSFCLQLGAVERKEIGACASAAVDAHAIALDEIALVFLTEIAKAWDERIAAHQSGCCFAIPRFGHRSNHGDTIHLIDEVMAHHAT